MSEDKDWALGRMKDGDNPLIVRLRKILPSWCEKEGLPHLIAISWSCSGDQGLPTEEENREQSEFEELLDQGIGNDTHSLLTLVITGGNVKEWQWYTQSPETFMGFLNSVLPQDKPFPISISHQQDNEWLAYHRWNPAN